MVFSSVLLERRDREEFPGAHRAGERRNATCGRGGRKYGEVILPLVCFQVLAGPKETAALRARGPHLVVLHVGHPERDVPHSLVGCGEVSRPSNPTRSSARRLRKAYWDRSRSVDGRGIACSVLRP